jgi:hypothetical protein
MINVHEAHSVKAGDLILFDQLLEHSVDRVVHSDPANPLSGHWRLLMPDHPIGPRRFQWIGRRLYDRWRARH